MTTGKEVFGSIIKANDDCEAILRKIQEGYAALTQEYQHLIDKYFVERGTAGARDDEQAISRVRGFIEKHESARFSPWPELRTRNEIDQSGSGDTLKDDRTRVMNCAGYKRQAIRSNGQPYWVFYLFPDALAEALAGLDLRDSTKALIASGLLELDATGKSSRSVNVPGIGKARLYKITLECVCGVHEHALGEMIE